MREERGIGFVLVGEGGGTLLNDCVFLGFVLLVVCGGVWWCVVVWWLCSGGVVVG